MKIKAIEYPGENPRYQRGSLTSEQIKGIKRISEFCFEVPASRGLPYLVELSHESGHAGMSICCNCPIYVNRPDQACKHMLAVDAIKKEF